MRWTRVPLAALALVLVAAPSPARATPPEAPGAGSALVVDAVPVIGTGATILRGWNEVSVRIQNTGGQPVRGQVEVTMERIGRESRDFHASAPFSVGAGASIRVRVPALVTQYGDLVVTVVGPDGKAVQESRFSSFGSTGVTLLDVGEATRLRGALQETAIAPLFTLGARGAAPTLSVIPTRADATTGDPLLPDRAALYAGADAVLMRSDVLTGLGAAELDALAGYVLGGGTLAIAPSRPEDLRHATLVALAGGPITRRGVSAVTLQELIAPEPPPGPPARSVPKLLPTAREAGSEVAETLAGYVGGNLHGSPYGSSAAYGLGEVHLLAFDPTRKPAVDDPWVQARVVDLARRAYDRHAPQVFLPGVELAASSYVRVRQQLDPNESSRWSIGAAALLLCVYAVVAGPLSFLHAARRGQPLRALRRLPALAALTFALVVGIGVLAKGVRGRARHLTLVDAGAGMTRGVALRFRGFYASRSSDLTVRTSDAGSVVSGAVVAEYAEHKDHLVVDRDGARLVEVAALPWQTVVVREDGFASLGDGIALVKEGASDVAVLNRSGRDLRGAILRAPGGPAYYFPRIKDGERVVSAPARAMSATLPGKTWEAAVSTPGHSGALPMHRLGAHALDDVLDADTPRLSDAWWALQDASGDQTDWFPDGVPTLIGQLEGGEGRTSDAGLRLESDRVLVRVVGFGGRP